MNTLSDEKLEHLRKIVTGKDSAVDALMEKDPELLKDVMRYGLLAGTMQATTYLWDIAKGCEPVMRAIARLCATVPLGEDAAAPDAEERLKKLVGQEMEIAWAAIKTSYDAEKAEKKGQSA